MTIAAFAISTMPFAASIDVEAERLRAALLDRARARLDVEPDLAAEEVAGLSRPSTRFASVTVGSVPPRP